MNKRLLRFLAVIICALISAQTTSIVGETQSYGHGLDSYFKEKNVESTSITKKESPSLIDRLISILMQLLGASDKEAASPVEQPASAAPSRPSPYESASDYSMRDYLKTTSEGSLWPK